MTDSVTVMFAGKPWLGVGLGYEWLTFNASASGEEASITLGGFEFVNVQAGLDLTPAEDLGLGLGPFLSFSLAEYSDVSCTGAGITCTGITNKALHEWLTFGLRGTLVP